MAQKLTPEEQQTLLALSRALGRILPFESRGMAGGIASGLVRLRAETLSLDDVMGVLTRYGAGQEAFDALVRVHALITHEGGGYTLAVPEKQDVRREFKRAKAERLKAAESGEKTAETADDALDAGEKDGVAEDAGAEAPVAAASEPIPALEVAEPESEPEDEDEDAAASDAADEPEAAEKPKRRKRAKRGPKASAKADKAEADGDTAADAVADASTDDDPKPADAKPEAPSKPSPAPTGAPTQAISRTETPRPPAKRSSRTLAKLSYTRRQTPQANAVRRQIIDLDPRLWINGWLLGAPEAYERFETELKALDQALVGRASLGDGTLSIRELSYQIFGDEKFLGFDSDGKKLLHLMGLTESINTKPQVKLPLMHFVPKRRKRMRIVVSENLDPWLNMREVLYGQGGKRILDERVHGIVFGDGSMAADPHKLPELIDSLGAEEVSVLYWGDIDRAGLLALSKVMDVARELGTYTVEPFAPAYKLMLKRAMKRWPDPLDNEYCGQSHVAVEGLDTFEPLLSDEEFAYLESVVRNSRLVPQEIVTARDL